MFRRNTLAVLAFGATVATLTSGAAGAGITARWQSKGELQ